MFNRELDLLEIRLNVLREVVDLFIIVESRNTHSGKSKEPVLSKNLKRFGDFPIDYRLLRQPGGSRTYEDACARESEQRKNCRDVLLCYDIQDDDIVLMGDLDEIPDPVFINYLPKSPTRLAMRHFYWWLNAEDRKVWTSGTVSMSGRDAKMHLFEQLRIASLPIFVNKGWHFSSVGTEDEILTKLESFLHVEYGSAIGRQMALAHKDKFESIHGQPLRQVEIDDTFPVYLQKNQDKYSHLIRNGVT
jgi:beta-1,4-mannosyl-glycoprotein beta-1,4-N-acetylglucosaminyltransferase